MKQYQKPELEKNNFQTEKQIANGGAASYFSSSGSSATIDGGSTNFLLEWLGI